MAHPMPMLGLQCHRQGWLALLQRRTGQPCGHLGRDEALETRLNRKNGPSPDEFLGLGFTRRATPKHWPDVQEIAFEMAVNPMMPCSRCGPTLGSSAAPVQGIRQTYEQVVQSLQNLLSSAWVPRDVRERLARQPPLNPRFKVVSRSTQIVFRNPHHW